MDSMKWQRRFNGNVIVGYTSGQWSITKDVPFERAELDTSKQGSERAETWTLFKGEKKIYSFPTLTGAKKAARQMDPELEAAFLEVEKLEGETEEAKRRKNFGDFVTADKRLDQAKATLRSLLARQ